MTVEKSAHKLRQNHRGFSRPICLLKIWPPLYTIINDYSIGVVKILEVVTSPCDRISIIWHKTICYFILHWRWFNFSWFYLFPNSVFGCCILYLVFSSHELKAQMSISDYLSSDVCLSVRLSVNFSHFRLLLQNHSANFNQIWHNASLGEGNSSLLKWSTTPFSKGRWLQNSEDTLTKFKNLLQNSWANFNQTWHKASYV